MMIKSFVPLVFVLHATLVSAFDEDPAARFATMTAEEVRAFEDEVKARIKTLDGIEALEAMADLALIPPRMNTSPLPEYGYDQLDYGMTIGIERTPGGRLWACWVAGGDSPKAFFVLATSDDDGETWSDPRLVVDSHNANLPRDRSVLVGNLWTDPLGRLWLIFDQSMEHFDGRGGVWVSVCENPDADQPVWSRPRRIWHGVTLNKPTVLSTGEWMLPISLDQRGGLHDFKGTFKELDPLRGANVFVSTDRGATWQRRGVARFPKPDWHEHMIVERKDGTLWMLARTGMGIMESTSADSGRTWSQPTPSKIKHPVARFHIRRLDSGRILLVKHGETIDSHEGRSMLTAWLSEDEGGTWQGGLMLDERKGISYPDGFQAPDGTVYISYDRNRSTDGEILLARFTEDDILARKLGGPKSRLRMLISRPLARDAAKLPKSPAPTTGVPRTTTIPPVDISNDFKPALPRIADREVRLAASGTDFADTVSTSVFAQAIEELHKSGGGRLIVPAGIWTTGPIHLKSGVELHLEEGAEIRFSTRHEDYLPVVFQQRGGVRCYNYSPFIYAKDCEDIAVTGKGILNGRGKAWWSWKDKQPGMTRSMEMGRARTPVQERMFGRQEDGVRPDFIQFINCKRVLMEGITVKDGPSWNIHPVWCEDLTIRGVSVVAHGPNNDGIDPDGCRRILIEHCHLDVGDDAICLKSGRDAEGWEAARPCEDILIRHCRVLAGHGAVVIGSEMSAGVRNVYVHDITAHGTDRGIRLKTRRGRGGIVENIRIENVRMQKIKMEAIMLNMQYGDRSLGEESVSHLPKDKTTPTLRNITIRNVSCEGAKQGVRIIGLPENPITGLTLEGLRIDATKPSSVQHAKGTWNPALFP